MGVIRRYGPYGKWFRRQEKALNLVRLSGLAEALLYAKHQQNMVPARITDVIDQVTEVHLRSFEEIRSGS